jgi:transposase
MRAGSNGFAAKVQAALENDPFSGHAIVFRGWRDTVIKVPWSTGMDYAW